MDDPSMTMKEYIKFEEEKARKCRKVFNWQTTTYGKIRVDDDLHDLSSVEAEFPAIVINDAFAPHDTFQCKSRVSTPINDEFNFRISFDESDNEDYTIICDTNSFSYKMIFVNNLKTDSKNDYEKVMPSIPSPKPAISCFDDLDFFNDFENEFPAIVYNDAQTSKLDLLTEPILSPQHIDEFNDKTSLSEYDEEEQNVLYFNDLFPFNVIYPNDSKSDKDNDDDKIDIEYSLEDLSVKPLPDLINTDVGAYAHRSNKLLETNMALPPREQRHRFLRYEGLEYPDTNIVDFEGRLARIHIREVHRVLVFDFKGLSDLMAKGLTARMMMEHRDEAGVSVFTTPSYTVTMDPILRLCHRLILCSIAGRSQAPENVTVTDFFYLRGMDVDSVNFLYLLVRYLRLFATRRKSGAYISRGKFVARLADHFGLLTAEILGGLTVIDPELPMIDMAELVRLQISVELNDTWAWVAIGPERQPDATAGAPVNDADAPIVDDGGQADPTPVQAPQQPPPPPPAPARTIPQRLGRLEDDVQGLHRDVGSLRGLVERSMTDQGRFSTWLMTCMMQLMDASGLTYQAFDGSFRGSSPATFQRRTRQRTSEANTSTAQQDPLQPDP
ncbi:hypothetical protein Tco_1502334 [Tanacetum coccineum]